MAKFLLALVFISTTAKVQGFQYNVKVAGGVKLQSTSSSEIMSAFTKVKEAAMAFPEGSEERSVATNMIERLSSTDFDTWNPDDIQIIDKCLIEEDSQACEEFCKAMTDLREIYDKSPGNA